MMNYRLHTGDCLEVMRTFQTNSIDTVITDPPYGLSFMGKNWDHGVPGVAFWTEILRVAKPGAMLLAFGGTRTWHRLTVAIEDAGWEIRDCLMFLYGSGFPKSHNISKAIDEQAGAEREVIGYKASHRPNRVGKYGQSMSAPYSDALETAPATPAAKEWDGWGTALKPAWEPVIIAQKNLSFVPNCDILHLVNQQIGGVICLQLLSVNDAEKVLRLSPAEPNEASVFAAMIAGLLHGNRSGELFAKMGMFNSPETVLMCLNIALSWNAILDASLNRPNTFTTKTETGLTTGLKTLNCLLSPIIPESIIPDVWPASGQALHANIAGSNSNATPAKSNDILKPFAAGLALLGTESASLLVPNAVKSLTGIIQAVASVLQSVLTEIATASGQPELSDLAQTVGKPSSRYLLDPQPTATENAWPKLSPNLEPIILAMKPLDGTFAQNALAHGVAGLNIDGCRIEAESGLAKNWQRNQSQSAKEGRNAMSGGLNTIDLRGYTPQGRWPANLILDEQAAAALDEQSGHLPVGGAHVSRHKGVNGYDGGWGDMETVKYTDAGGASRFFYTAKASRSERDAGLEGIPERRFEVADHGMKLERWEDGSLRERVTNPQTVRNHHPTVKPLDLMRYLVRLTKTPRGGTVLDPFMGSGSTGVACMIEGRQFVGIDKEPEYVEIARHRMEHWRDEVSTEPRRIRDNQDYAHMPLFAGALSDDKQISDFDRHTFGQKEVEELG